jgi:hypothetical protein
MGDTAMTEQHREKAQFLDEMVPLNGASHADVVSYGVDTPMRYSECFARLTDGRIVRLRNARQFIGWTGYNGSRRLLFRSDAGRILLASLEGRSQRVESAPQGVTHKFVTRDGSLLHVKRLGMEIFGQAAGHVAA